ncbi:hypothetical protein [Streptomyces sp. SPB78]|uniref:hypothetical protein n=1 Tax=Streptomyces sp. (strain SPB78) TaxID=591157 RepID=UPI0001B579B4|nr:hypothetical protein [Streptomyces sp. SPB78]
MGRSRTAGDSSTSPVRRATPPSASRSATPNAGCGAPPSTRRCTAATGPAAARPPAAREARELLLAFPGRVAAEGRLREALIDALTTDASPAPDASLATRALALDATLGGADPVAVPLRPVETALLRDWLRRLAP